MATNSPVFRIGIEKMTIIEIEEYLEKRRVADGAELTADLILKNALDAQFLYEMFHVEDKESK